MTWSAEQYLQFAAERNRPAHDLLAHVVNPVRRAIDVGCGPGNSTEILLAVFPDAQVAGIDNSPQMLAAAQSRLPEIDFTLDDIATWSAPGSFDLILANASIQWVPDHAKLLPRLVAKLSLGGSLAVQVPDNLTEPTHRLMRQVAEDGPWSDRLVPALAPWGNRLDAESYNRILLPIAKSIDLWRTTYFHRLPGPAGIVEWFRGSTLRGFFALLNADEITAFESRYQLLIEGAYPPLPDGSVLLPFPRLFFVARR